MRKHFGIQKELNILRKQQEVIQWLSHFQNDIRSGIQKEIIIL